MSRAVPVPLREQLIARHRQGESLAAIARDLRISYWTVRTLWRRYRDAGDAGLVPAYASCGRPGPRGSRRIYRAACWLRRRHPSWGAGPIRALLAQRYPDEPLSHGRTLERWFRAQGLGPPPRRPRPPTGARATDPHAIWQLDATEHIRLADGTQVSWMTPIDEAYGGILTPVVSPQGVWARVSPGTVQAALRTVIAEWGLPARVRVDNGAPLGIVERRPAGPGLVADRAGGGGELKPAATLPEARARGAQSRRLAALERAGHLRRLAGGAAATGRVARRPTRAAGGAAWAAARPDPSRPPDRRPSSELSRERIRALTVTRRRPRQGGEPNAAPPRG
ncbi:MAG TPA: helix-turn-helix domain-containing protein [Thermomicrobiales bacterium]|nr:helix-turn-helix domain-containing protein [Thermomicrobiales bacterium]